MWTATVPATAAQALAMLESALGFLAAQDAADLPAQAVADQPRILERLAAPFHPGHQRPGRRI